MSSTNTYIENILISKPHNKHYLNRYLKFIKKFSNQIAIKGETEVHHIYPKSSDLFPEYKSFKINPWNKINLTYRQHFIAHYMLLKTYPSSKQIYAFWAMCNKQSPTDNIRNRDYKVTSRIFESTKKLVSKKVSENNKNRKNPTKSKQKLNMVACYDNNKNYLEVTKQEFNNREDLYGVNKFIDRSYMQTEKYKNSLKGKHKNKIHILNQITGDRKFINRSELNKFKELGYIEKLITYDRTKYLKECIYCNKKIDPLNYTKWHGDKCKLK
jgi:hypothetical protein